MRLVKRSMVKPSLVFLSYQKTSFLSSSLSSSRCLSLSSTVSSSLPPFFLSFFGPADHLLLLVLLSFHLFLFYALFALVSYVFPPCMHRPAFNTLFIRLASLDASWSR